MKKILAAIDFSDITDAVVDHAADQALAFGAELCLLHVETDEPEFIGYEPGPQYVRDDVAKQIRDDNHVLHEIRDRLKKRNLECRCILLQGFTSEKILHEAKKFGADLIVIGTHEHGALYHLFFGGVRESLLAHAPCPVLVVPSAQKKTE